MKSPIRVLIIEDTDPGAARIGQALEQHGYQVVFERVASLVTLQQALQEPRGWDVVLADHDLPGLAGRDAHRTVRSSDFTVPFILVAGPMDADDAARASADGIVDCLSRDHLAFLGPVVDRALLERRRREKHEVAEEALRVQEARYRSLFRGAPVALFRVDLTDVRRWLQEHDISAKGDLVALLERNPGALLQAAERGSVREGNARALELVSPLSRVEGSLERYVQAGLADFWRLLLEGLINPESSGVSGEFQARRVGGRAMHLVLSAAFTRSEDTNWSDVVIAALDMTAQSRLQSEMEDVQRMESVGRLAGGVAHDFNNSLTVIQTYATFVREALGESDPIQEDLEVILESTRSAAALTERLLAFGRRQVQKLEPVNLNASVEGVTGILRRIIGEDIEVTTRLTRDLWLAAADRTQVQQILMNIAVNARDAMVEGGSLVFSTRNVRVLRSMPDRPELLAGEYVSLDVTDSGVGMDAETASQAFDPFFTTKPAGQGTGLGLSTVYGIVKQSGGHIWIRSRPGLGTTFEIMLPRATQRTTESDETSGEGTEPGGSEHLLLVEDDRALRTATRRILQHRGYRLQEAGSAEEGLQRWGETAEPFDGVITDVVLPGVDGLQMAQQLRSFRDGLPVLFMSGYSYEQYGGVAELDGAVGFIRKPFTVEELLASVRSTLDQGVSDPDAPDPPSSRAPASGG